MKKINVLFKGIIACAIMMAMVVVNSVSVLAGTLESPATGDEFNLGLMLVILGVAAAGMITLVVISIIKKKKG